MKQLTCLPLSIRIPWILSRVFLAFTLLTFTLPASGQEPLYYQREHFVWAHVEKDRFKQQDLLPFLSRQRVVILLEQPDGSQEERMRAFREHPPAGFPEIDTFRTFSPGKDPEDLKSTTPDRFLAYLITFKEALPEEEFLQRLDALAKTPGFDFVLPVFLFPEKMAAPFIQFEVEFQPLELIPGGSDQIRRINEANFVAETQQTGTLKDRATLELKKGAPTNILATVLRYQQMPWIVKNAQLQWLRLRAPVEVQSKWETPVGIGSLNIWEPVRYILRIERDQDVEVLPQALTEEAMYSWIYENTHLPRELIQVDHMDKRTQDLGDGRVLDEVSFTLRLSKTGVYIFPPYPLQVSYLELNGQKRIKTVQGGAPSALTIPDHLPLQFNQIPGQLISLPEDRPRYISGYALSLPFLRQVRDTARIARMGIAAGGLLILAGILWTLRASGLSLGFPAPRSEKGGADSQQQALEIALQKYRGRLKEVRRTLEALTFQGDMRQEKEWLRLLGILLKQFLGERYYRDENLFLGGLGASSASIRRYMLATVPERVPDTALNPDKGPGAMALDMLRILEQRIPKKFLNLSKEEAEEMLARVERIIDELGGLKG